MVICLARRLLGGSSSLPGRRYWTGPALRPYLALLPVGFAEPAGHPAAGGLLPRHFTLTLSSGQWPVVSGQKAPLEPAFTDH